MKLAKLVLCTGLISGAWQVQADSILGVYAGIETWRSEAEGGFANEPNLQHFQFSASRQHNYYVALEHAIPVLPNIRVQQQKLQTLGKTELERDMLFAGTDFSSGTAVLARLDWRFTDYVLYYEVLDNALISVDLGIAAKHLQGEVQLTAESLVSQQRIKQWLPMLYLNGKVDLVATGYDLFFIAQGAPWRGDHFYDFQAGVGYQVFDNLLIDLRLSLGYRRVEFALQDVDDLFAETTFSGFFVGVDLHF
ncbi:TIGR04219 family outer membrane beta-barrel protein [Alishewanella jeotgali]|uniref:Outer membrane protein n=1 Tax=Alishewanella jeotgali KCTC 22429 TaxID=1129374 RepID=H3ZGT9_9ALTE|nr:TIGR04219 family outer membrane beta-barrel protein [Alishewanella jeotgali]EHR40215.1 hypothetical protein AJE_12945 [Alishewanella jeotgali KCTC 22429]